MVLIAGTFLPALDKITLMGFLLALPSSIACMYLKDHVLHCLFSVSFQKNRFSAFGPIPSAEKGLELLLNNSLPKFTKNSSKQTYLTSLNVPKDPTRAHAIKTVYQCQDLRDHEVEPLLVKLDEVTVHGIPEERGVILRLEAGPLKQLSGILLNRKLISDLSICISTNSWILLILWFIIQTSFILPSNCSSFYHR